MSVLIAYNFPERQYKEISERMAKVLKREGVPFERMEWPHISLTYVKDLPKEQEGEVLADLKAKPTFRVKEVRVLSGETTPYAYVVLELDQPERYVQAVTGLEEKFGIKRTRSLLPHSSVLRVPKAEAGRLEGLKDDLQSAASSVFYPFKPATTMIWRDYKATTIGEWVVVESAKFGFEKRVRWRLRPQNALKSVIVTGKTETGRGESCRKELCTRVTKSTPTSRKRREGGELSLDSRLSKKISSRWRVKRLTTESLSDLKIQVIHPNQMKRSIDRFFRNKGELDSPTRTLAFEFVNNPDINKIKPISSTDKNGMLRVRIRVDNSNSRICADAAIDGGILYLYEDFVEMFDYRVHGGYKNFKALRKNEEIDDEEMIYLVNPSLEPAREVMDFQNIRGVIVGRDAYMWNPRTLHEVMFPYVMEREERTDWGEAFPIRIDYRDHPPTLHATIKGESEFGRLEKVLAGNRVRKLLPGGFTLLATDRRNFAKEVDSSMLESKKSKWALRKMDEAEYRGREVTLNKPMRGDVKKYKVYVKDPDTGNVKKVNFGDPNMEIKRDDPKRRKAFRLRHNCDTAKDKTTPRYWSCRFWDKKPVSKMLESVSRRWKLKVMTEVAIGEPFPSELYHETLVKFRKKIESEGLIPQHGSVTVQAYGGDVSSRMTSAVFFSDEKSSLGYYCLWQIGNLLKKLPEKVSLDELKKNGMICVVDPNRYTQNIYRMDSENYAIYNKDGEYVEYIDLPSGEEVHKNDLNLPHVENGDYFSLDGVSVKKCIVEEDLVNLLRTHSTNHVVRELFKTSQKEESVQTPAQLSQIRSIEEALNLKLIKWHYPTEGQLKDEYNEPDIQSLLMGGGYPSAKEKVETWEVFKNNLKEEELDSKNFDAENAWRFRHSDYSSFRKQVKGYGGPKDPDSMVRKIQAEGELPMPVVIRKADGRLILAGGATRVSIADLAGQKIHALVFEEKVALQYRINRMKGKIDEYVASNKAEGKDLSGLNKKIMQASARVPDSELRKWQYDDEDEESGFDGMHLGLMWSQIRWWERKMEGKNLP